MCFDEGQGAYIPHSSVAVVLQTLRQSSFMLVGGPPKVHLRLGVLCALAAPYGLYFRWPTCLPKVVLHYVWRCMTDCTLCRSLCQLRPCFLLPRSLPYLFLSFFLTGIVAAASALMGAEVTVDKVVSKWVHVHVQGSCSQPAGSSSSFTVQRDATRAHGTPALFRDRIRKLPASGCCG